MPPNAQQLNDIISWDVANWSRALSYWEENSDLNNGALHCLELGSRRGGLSLWLALKGHTVICSDLHLPEEEAMEIHKKYDCRSLISYEKVDATTIPYENTFDVIIFKSSLGGISSSNNDLKRKTVESIYLALKPGGVLLFAENMASSFLHRFFRKKFVEWGREWNYLQIDEMEGLFSDFKSLSYKTVGFFGTFGRNEKQRNLLGRIDRLFDRLVPISKRYILIGVAKK